MLPYVFLVALGVMIVLMRKRLAQLLLPYHKFFGFKGSVELSEALHLWIGLAGVVFGIVLIFMSA